MSDGDVSPSGPPASRLASPGMRLRTSVGRDQRLISTVQVHSIKGRTCYCCMGKIYDSGCLCDHHKVVSDSATHKVATALRGDLFHRWSTGEGRPTALERQLRDNQLCATRYRRTIKSELIVRISVPCAWCRIRAKGPVRSL